MVTLWPLRCRHKDSSRWVVPAHRLDSFRTVREGVQTRRFLLMTVAAGQLLPTVAQHVH